MTTKRRTTQPRPRKETVAEAKGGQGKTQGQGKGVQKVDPPSVPPPPPDAVPLVDPPVVPASQPAIDKGFCDNHPDVPAVLVTNFSWVAQQRFCLPCVPAQYLFLL